jgi:hypothetical protein
MLLCATGIGLTLVPLTMMVMANTAPADSGVAAGVLATVQQIGGATALAIASATAARTVSVPGAGSAADGYTHAFAAGAVTVALCALLATMALRP